MKRPRGAGPVGLDAFSEITKRLGDLAEHLKDAFDAEPSEGEGGERSGQRTFTISTPKGPLTGVAGYSVRFGSTSVDEVIKARSGEKSAAGFARPNPKRPDVDAAREPLVDLHDEGERFVVTAELPGVDDKDIEVLVADGNLTLRGEKRCEYQDSHRQLSERYYGRFERRIALPDGIDKNKVKASFRNGVLNVSLPTAKDAQNAVRRIPLQVS